MNLFNISWKNLTNKSLTNGLSVLLMAFGVGIISLILNVGRQLDEKFTKNIKGIDMVVGAKGSPLQLILSSIYQLDSPTGNISYNEAKTIARNPFIKKAIPIAMGDSYLGYRIVGTDSSYIAHYKAVISAGKSFEKPFDAVVGASIASILKLEIGDIFASSHGLDQEGEKHETQKYKIVGILARNNSVIDNLIITSLQTVWEVHKHNTTQPNALDLLDENTDHDHEKIEINNTITAMLVKFRNPMGLMTIPRNINANTNMQAALPAIEVNRLFSLMGVGIDTLKWLAFLIIFVSGLSVFVSIYNSLKERKYEMALMLSMGASRLKLFILLLTEGLFIGILGFIIGFIFSKTILFLMVKMAEQSYHYQFSVFNSGLDDVLILIACVVICIIAAAIPSVGIYKINISKTLSEQ